MSSRVGKNQVEQNMDVHRHPVRTSPRIAGFDYATAGSYFITICVQHMEPRFGAVANSELLLNDAGRMVVSTWESNIERYPNAALDSYVVMPNHMHAIVLLGSNPHEIETGAALTRIVQSFKSLTTVAYTRGVRAGLYPPFDGALWQRSFYDRMLRDERALEFARLYIEGNPGRWEERSGRDEGM